MSTRGKAGTVFISQRKLQIYLTHEMANREDGTQADSSRWLPQAGFMGWFASVGMSGVLHTFNKKTLKWQHLGDVL